MMAELNIPDLTLVFMTTIFALAMALVWMFCELEQILARRRAGGMSTGRRARDGNDRR